jgi:hypothetical protein
MCIGLQALGYSGSLNRVATFFRRWRTEESDQSSIVALVPLNFKLSEAFQFDW